LACRAEDDEKRLDAMLNRNGNGNLFGLVEALVSVDPSVAAR